MVQNSLENHCVRIYKPMSRLHTYSGNLQAASEELKGGCSMIVLSMTCDNTCKSISKSFNMF